MEQRFSKFVADPNENGCRLWTGSKQKFGHGQFMLDSKPQIASRVAYELYVGPIPDGQVVRHTCDVSACVEPTHLVLGTQADNMRDCRERGRNTPPPIKRGEDHNQAKLNSAQVLEIRQQPDVPRKELAERYGVSEPTIKAIRSRRIWSHI